MSQRAERRRRKERRHAGAREGAEAEPPQAGEPEGDLGRGYARSRARNEEARAALEPLTPGERPRAVAVAAALALFFGLSNFIAFVAGVEIRGERPSLVGILLFTGLMLTAAWGAWNVRYWAVLGIQALLGLIIVIFSILAVRFENALELLIALAIIGSAGTLFWFLVKSMARIQMPERPGRS
jgi:uncharacterized membrane protein YqjE